MFAKPFIDFSQLDIEVVGAGDEASLVFGPIQAKDGFSMKSINLIDWSNFLKFILLEETLDIEHFENG